MGLDRVRVTVLSAGKAVGVCHHGLVAASHPYRAGEALVFRESADEATGIAAGMRRRQGSGGG